MEETISIIQKTDAVRLVSGVLLLIVLIMLCKLVLRLFNGMLDKVPNLVPALHTMLRTGLKIILYFFAIIAAANSIGIPVTSFLAIFSVAGLAFSLSIQGVLSNLAGGIIILVSKPFTLGDYIESDTISGTVKEIGFLYTRLSSPDGKTIFVPNSNLYASKIINYTMSGGRRISLSVSASYNNSPADVRSAILEAAGNIPQIHTEPAPNVVLENYGDSANEYTVHVWVDAAEYVSVRYALNESLYSVFARHGIEMTYPHLNIHIDQKAD